MFIYVHVMFIWACMYFQLGVKTLSLKQSSKALLSKSENKVVFLRFSKVFLILSNFSYSILEASYNVRN